MESNDRKINILEGANVLIFYPNSRFNKVVLTFHFSLFWALKFCNNLDFFGLQTFAYI